MRIAARLIITLGLAILLTMPVAACDDTLVMLLTAQNPSSEFSRVIRSFNTDLTTLGLALKAMEKTDYSSELAQVMESWLEFSKKYMTSPPPEARNDLRWAAKTSETARSIGEIRKLVTEKHFTQAHDRILELSGKIGMFFEAFGVSDEKQLFIATSANLTSLERALLNSDQQRATAMTKELTKNLESFQPLLKEENSTGSEKASALLSELAAGIAKGDKLPALDAKCQQLQVVFEEMRSRILLQEWFPGLKD
ncbi:MAG: hypothetical protein CVV42_12285 [Candidatus Riflebacteria bacterium HGW-Riflebacteria-2]|jgi:hypothetical protein|nr:MAG: hypothetical protein CVV42_12285 [Candidatus Riflebacteria bacterium HGW-Riflebacteria-2]